MGELNRGVLMATRIPEEVIDQVRSSVNISDVVGQYVQLKKSGKNLFGLCPFHEEKTASFSVNEDKQIFHCFSCGRGGNVFKFIMEIENISFPQAVIKVAQDNQIDLPQSVESRDYNEAPQVDSLTAQLIDVHELASKLYHHILVNTAAGERALDYLTKRGLSKDIIDQFSIGYAPPQRLMYQFLHDKNMDDDLLRQTGLFLEWQDGHLYDRFVDRVMFPIKNGSGKVIAFSGRLLSTENTDQPKYLNSPETKIFNKRKVLFNFDIARKAARRDGKLVLFEGFMDVIAAYRADVTNGIASMGTSLTEEQISTIERVTSSIDVCYDGDSAGQNATNRAISVISEQAPKLEIEIVSMPAGIDPDEYLQKYGAEKFKDWLSSARQTPVSFGLKYLRHDLNLDNEADQINYLNDAIKLIATVSSEMEQDIYVNQLVAEFNLDKTAITGQLRELTRQRVTSEQRQQTRQTYRGVNSATVQQVEKKQLDRTEVAERMLLRQMLHDHGIWVHVQSVDQFAFVHEEYQTLYLIAASYFETHSNYDPAKFSDYVEDNHLQQVLVDIELIQASDVGNMDAANDYIKIIMKQTPIQDQISNKESQLREASQLKNRDLEAKLTIELVDLMKKQQQL
ncbi:DNA primase [Paucilactobacillus suebicus DSM 5007 = KCTC 3549]|uniref:DNA primase n=2 Tax=Paucilactobacillus suebicus TaxID=152335 RepID=A0A0R1W3B0_9LACO|nr:DNA primase [Paucilactobacillus suebicus DSM 5007 = KCTC 3549]